MVIMLIHSDMMFQSRGDILLIGEPLERFSTKRKRSLKSGRCYCTVADFFCHPSILLSLLFCWHVVDQFSPPATFIVFCAWWACSFGKFKRVVCLPQKRWLDYGVSDYLLHLKLNQFVVLVACDQIILWWNLVQFAYFNFFVLYNCWNWKNKT